MEKQPSDSGHMYTCLVIYAATENEKYGRGYQRLQLLWTATPRHNSIVKVWNCMADIIAAAAGHLNVAFVVTRRRCGKHLCKRRFPIS